MIGGKEVGGGGGRRRNEGRQVGRKELALDTTENIRVHAGYSVYGYGGVL